MPDLTLEASKRLLTQKLEIPRRTKEDDSAFAKDLLKLKNRVDHFEKQLKKLKTAHA